MLAPATAISRAKSPEAFRTISEVATELDVPQHVLRFWETRFAQVKPVKRAGGRRYYRPEDIDLLRGIRALLYSDGFTIRGVQKIMRDRGLRHVAEIGRTCLSPVEEASITRTDLFAADEAVVELHHPHEAFANPEREFCDPARAFAEEERVKLELLLAELLQLKARLRTARARLG